MRLVYQDKLKSFWVKFQHPLSGSDAPYRGNGNIRAAGGMRIGHFNFDRLSRICIFAMSSGLFHKLAAMYQDQSLGGIWCWCLNAIDELRKDDLPINQ